MFDFSQKKFVVLTIATSALFVGLPPLATAQTVTKIGTIRAATNRTTGAIEAPFAKGTNVTIEGVLITGQADYFGGKINAYLWDGTGGISVYDTTVPATAMVRGGNYRIGGKIDQFNGNLEVVNPTGSALTIASASGYSLPAPSEITVDAFVNDGSSFGAAFEGLGEQLEGTLVKFTNLYFVQPNASGNWPLTGCGAAGCTTYGSVYVSDGTPTDLYTDIELRLEAGIVAANSGKPQTGCFDVVGIVGQYNKPSNPPVPTDTFLKYYQIKPRDISDFTFRPANECSPPMGEGGPQHDGGPVEYPDIDGNDGSGSYVPPSKRDDTSRGCASTGGLAGFNLLGVLFALGAGLTIRGLRKSKQGSNKH